jgi:predicted glycogen debranching enzyme
MDRVMEAALEQFVVARGTLKSVIAGYPWFLDWGRDALIAVRGLVAAGRLEAARDVLLQFGRFEERGTLPNMIHGEDAGNRDTSDAPLWFCAACDDLAAAGGEGERFWDSACGERSLRAVLLSIGRHYLAGTPNGIGVDPDSALVFSPPHFTWMDTDHPAGTPRQGYAVEIQALWHRALGLLARLDRGSEAPWSRLRRQVADSMLRLFWDRRAGYLYDCRHAAAGVPAGEAEPDPALRPNQLLAVTLGAVEDRACCSAILAACGELIVPGAIRSLADRPAIRPLPVVHHGRTLNDPLNPYQGRYSGDEDTRRKPAYHNGTAWTWLFPSYCEAYAMVHGPAGRATARALLTSAAQLIRDGCAGHLPEVLDGDAPHHQRGCDAQAWGASEWLRVWRLLEK